MFFKRLQFDILGYIIALLFGLKEREKRKKKGIFMEDDEIRELVHIASLLEADKQRIVTESLNSLLANESDHELFSVFQEASS